MIVAGKTGIRELPVFGLGVILGGQGLRIAGYGRGNCGLGFLGLESPVIASDGIGFLVVPRFGELVSLPMCKDCG